MNSDYSAALIELGGSLTALAVFYNSIGIIDVPSENEMVEYFKQRKQRRSAGQAQKQVKMA